MPNEDSHQLLNSDDQPETWKMTANEVFSMIKRNGIALIVLSVISMVLGIAGICVYHEYSQYFAKAGTGIFCSIPCLVLGIMCEVFMCYKSVKLFLPLLIAAIISSFFGILLVIFEMASICLLFGHASVYKFSTNFPIHLPLLCVASSWLVISVYTSILFGKLYHQYNPSHSCNYKHGGYVHHGYQTIPIYIAAPNINTHQAHM